MLPRRIFVLIKQTDMTAVKIQDVKIGDLFRMKPEAKTVFQRNEFSRDNKKYMASDWDDINRTKYIKKDTIVFIGFTF